MDKIFNEQISVKSFGEICPGKGSNTRTPYEHQRKAMEHLDLMNKSKSYSTLVVLPTGGGKTYTASLWLLKNAIDKGKKILWIAHRQMLLEQAAESFQKYAYAEVVPHISSFAFRIVSGSSSHDRTSDIKPKDNLLIVSKDSIGRNLNRLDSWLAGEDEIYLIVDEAHHSTAKTYRKVIEYVKSKVPCVKLIGLTATPFRTAESEQGLLAKIYTDGIKDGQVVHNDIGIAYQIGLKELINRQILSNPTFESCYTEEKFGESLGVDAWKSIQNFDAIPDDIAEQMAESAERNKLIVERYRKNQEKYGQTIVFAVNVMHAIQLTALFKKAGIKADYIVSSIKDSVTGVTISSQENEQKIADYREGRLQVLINVNILTEGSDLPKTKTIFLARPTVSTILMTQMIGRALRGTKAGGTAEAYIVSFIDHWNEHIAWVNPESIFGGSNEFVDNTADRLKRDLRVIAISKIEEFASILDDSIDTSAIEKIPFIQRIPLGMYAFTYLEKDGMDLSHQVMVYDSTAEAYQNLMEALPSLFETFNATEEYLDDATLDKMEKTCRDSFFCGEMIPAYERKDVINILKYYAQYESAPQFYTFEDVDRNKLDVSKIAQHIWDEDMGERKKAEYIDSIWESNDDNMLRLFFGRKLYFLRQLDVECMKISHPGIYEDAGPDVKFGTRALEDLPLSEIGKYKPELEKELRDQAFEKSKNENGEYCCAICGMADKSKVWFQVDHITPMNNGGKSVPENLQILCRQCNGTKGDK
ncbi:MAG: DEAD/DEAH box helicase family protein [Clostridia bacterium]|nr:DEAD/DEAH box helicase family protein [Clostridia bacterium]